MCEYVHGKMDYDFFVASLDGRVLNFKSSLFIEKLRERVTETGKQEGNFSLQNTFPGDYVSQMWGGTFKGYICDYSKNCLNWRLLQIAKRSLVYFLPYEKKVNDKLLLPFAYLIRKGSQSWKQRRQNIFMCWISTWNRYAVESSFYRSRFLRNIYEGFLIVRVQRCTVSTPWCSETWGLQPVKITFLGHLFLMVARYSGNPS